MTESANPVREGGEPETFGASEFANSGSRLPTCAASGHLGGCRPNLFDCHLFDVLSLWAEAANVTHSHAREAVDLPFSRPRPSTILTSSKELLTSWLTSLTTSIPLIHNTSDELTSFFTPRTSRCEDAFPFSARADAGITLY